MQISSNIIYYDVPQVPINKYLLFHLLFLLIDPEPVSESIMSPFLDNYTIVRRVVSHNI